MRSLHSGVVALLAVASPATILARPQTNVKLTAADKVAHCSNDYAAYGHPVSGNVCCHIAMENLMQSDVISALPSFYPMQFVSARGRLPAPGIGYRTPWRSTYGDCTIAIAVLSDVPGRFTPEAAPGSSGQTTIALKGRLEDASNDLLEQCLRPGATSIGWQEIETVSGNGKLGLFAFQDGSVIDRALPNGPRIDEDRLKSNISSIVATW